MSALSTSVSMSMDVPPDQNTAPVLEFRCLWTSDTRRKQKRWQDGRLKFHTFNRRVMVYDERSNFVGDTHWRENTPLDEGDELKLERGGILVEVSEFLEKKDQDLSELIDKRIKEKEKRFIAKHGEFSPAQPRDAAARSQSIAAAHLKPKPLNAILGTHTGHYGKALIPNVSPFEQRQMSNAAVTDENENPRPVKKRKADNSPPSTSGFAQNLMGATLSFTQLPSRTGPIRYESLKLKSMHRSESSDDLSTNVSKEKPSMRSRKLSEGGMADENSATTTHVKSRKKDRIAPSGYASNLLGAPLSLSSSVPKRVDKFPTQNRNPPQIIDLSMDTASDPEDTVSAAVPGTEPVVTSKSRKASSTVNRQRQQPSGVCASPLADESRKKKSMPKPSRRQESKKDNSSIPQQDSEIPHSSLRIRPRPRNKLMMFMDQSQSLSSSFTEWQISGKPDNLEAALSPGSLSSVASSSGDVCVRRSGDRASNLLSTGDFGDFEEHQQWLADFDVDQQSIDANLCSPRLPHSNADSSRIKSSSAEKQSTGRCLTNRRTVDVHVQEAAQHSNYGSQPKSGSTGAVSLSEKPQKCIDRAATASDHAPHPDSGGVFHNENNSEYGREIFFTPNSQVNVMQPAGNGNTTLTLASCHISNPAGESIVVATSSTTSAYAKQQGPFLARTEGSDASDDNPKTLIRTDTKRASSKSIIGKDDISEIGETEHGQETDTLTTQNTNRTCLGRTIRSNELTPVTYNNSRFIAMDRFIKKPMPATNHQVEALPLGEKSGQRGTESPSIQNTNQISLGLVSANRNTENASCDVAMKASNAGGDGTSRPRLANPATRGMSIQKSTKRSMQTLGTTLNAMLPAAPPERIARAGADHVTGLAPENNDKGAWSRESFDLFGSWRPPLQHS